MKRNEHKLEPCLREINHHSYVIVYSRTESMDLLTKLFGTFMWPQEAEMTDAFFKKQHY